jgi:hypothetical protein
MPRVKYTDNLHLSTIQHLHIAILKPDLIDELFYVGQVCPLGHRYRHRQLHWCLNCGLKAYGNRPQADLNMVVKEHRTYFMNVFANLPTDQPLDQCWELPEGVRKPGKMQHYSYLTYRTPQLKRAVSVPLPRLVYSLFWGEVGAVTVVSTCNNPICWNPLHVRSRFNVKPTPKELGQIILTPDPWRVMQFEKRPMTLEKERSPSIAIIKPPVMNKEVEPGSPFRPLESQYIPKLE